MKLRTVAATALALAGILVLAACAPTGGEADPPQSSSPSASAPGEASTQPSERPSDQPPASPTPTTPPVTMPTDCHKILSANVLAQLQDVPLNDPAFGPSGVLEDGSLRCNWGSPSADTTGLTTTISKMSRGPALDLLNTLADDEDFTCYTPDDGTRCEKTWKNELYPVTDGRTLFWRDGVLIDTRYSNLAPNGYTAAIVASIWG